MKNVVIIPNFKKNDEPNPLFVDNCILSWQTWASKHDVEVFLLEDPIYPFDKMPPQMQKMFGSEFLMGNNLKINQVAQVDYDTFILPHCPNFFELTNGEFSAVKDDGFAPQINRSIQMVKSNWFPTSNIKWDTYFNSGFIIYSQKHTEVFKEIIKFYETELENWCRVNKSPNFSDDQTILNFMLEKHGFKINFLPRSYNIIDPYNRYLFYTGNDDMGRYIDATKTIRECANIFHFCGDITFRNQATSFLKEKFL